LIPPEVRALAEDPSAYTSPGTGSRRVDRDGWSLVVADADRSTIVSRIRLGEDELEAAVEEVRATVREAGRGLVTWWVSDSTTPGGADERLLALGLEPSAPPLFEERYEALALVEPPPAAPPGIEVARPAGVDELVEVRGLVDAIFGVDEDEPRARTTAELDWAREQAGEIATFLARVHGRLAGYARSVFGEHGIFMAGGAVLPELRGRGLYRALVRARWDDAAERGLPALTTQAGAMSAPALRHLGFEHVADVRVLVDRLAPLGR